MAPQSDRITIDATPLPIFPPFIRRLNHVIPVYTFLCWKNSVFGRYELFTSFSSLSLLFLKIPCEQLMQYSFYNSLYMSTINRSKLLLIEWDHLNELKIFRTFQFERQWNLNREIINLSIWYYTRKKQKSHEWGFESFQEVLQQEVTARF